MLQYYLVSLLALRMLNVWERLEMNDLEIWELNSTKRIFEFLYALVIGFKIPLRQNNCLLQYIQNPSDAPQFPDCIPRKDQPETDWTLELWLENNLSYLLILHNKEYILYTHARLFFCRGENWQVYQHFTIIYVYVLQL